MSNICVCSIFLDFIKCLMWMFCKVYYVMVINNKCEIMVISVCCFKSCVKKLIFFYLVIIYERI